VRFAFKFLVLPETGGLIQPETFLALGRRAPKIKAWWTFTLVVVIFLAQKHDERIHLLSTT
jgi:hypothetical protein